jgi:hypothetical protein
MVPHQSLNEQFEKLATILSEKKVKADIAANEMDRLLQLLEQYYDAHLAELVPVIKARKSWIDEKQDIIATIARLQNEYLDEVKHYIYMQAVNTRDEAGGNPVSYMDTDLLASMEKQQALTTGINGQSSKLDGKTLDEMKITLPTVLEKLAKLISMMNQLYARPKKQVADTRKKNFKVKWRYRFYLAFIFLADLAIAYFLSKELKDWFNLEGYYVEVGIAVLLLFTTNRIFENFREKKFWQLNGDAFRFHRSAFSHIQIAQQELQTYL